MLEDIILIFLLLATASILWIVPASRFNNGNWIIAFKTFPLGVIALILSAKLLNALFYYFCEIKMENLQPAVWINTLIPLAAALAVITGAGFIIKRYCGNGKKYNPLPSFLLFFLSLIPVGIFSFFLSMAIMFCSFGSGKYSSEWRTIWLELGTKEKFAFESQSIHPFLAEYNYKIRFVNNGKSTRQRLFVNCGGRTHFNIYKLQDNRFLFRDKDHDYLVDASKQQVSRLARFRGKLYAAVMPDEDIVSWSRPYQTPQGIFMDFNHKKVAAQNVEKILENMEYCGCIRDKFYTAKEKPESAIEFMQQR